MTRRGRAPLLLWPLLVAAVAACLPRVDPPEDAGPPGPEVRRSEPVPPAPPEVDVDSLAAVLAVRADTLPPPALPALEAEIRDWLARLEFGDRALLPPGADPSRWFRQRRGRLLDALGWSAFRRGDLRQAEAALASAAQEINSRGTTTGYALHFLHLGEVHAARGRRDAAIDAFVAAEARGLGAAATPALEAAYRRRHGSLAGLDRLRARERERIEDERRQLVVADVVDEPLPTFAWPRRTGPPMVARELLGGPAVVALWDDGCAGCAGWPDRLDPLAAALRSRGGALVGVWLGADPAAAGPPRPWQVLLPPDPGEARRAFAADSLPLLVVVDATGRIRYRHGGSAAVPPPIDDIVLQLDHLGRRLR